MAIINTRLSSTNLTSVFTASGQQAVVTMYFCNTTAGNVSVNVFAVNTSDSSAGSEDNQIYSQLEILANDTYISNEKLILDNNDEIEAEASVPDAITVTVSAIAV